MKDEGGRRNERQNRLVFYSSFILHPSSLRGDAPMTPAPGQRRILLLMAHRENRRLLSDWLANRYHVLVPDAASGLAESFDLCILDGQALDRLGRWVGTVKRAVQPVFLPFLLVTPRQDAGMA